MTDNAERTRDGPRRLDFPRVPLTVPQGQRVQLESVALGDGRGRVGVEPAAQEYYTSGHLVIYLSGH